MKKITDGKSTKTDAIPAIKLELKVVSKNSINGNTEKSCKVVPCRLIQ